MLQDDLSIGAQGARVPSRWQSWLAALRVGQWPKNGLLFVALVAAHRLFDADAFARAALAFAAFCLAASSAYIVNDLRDRDADRRHPRKCRRPFACGALGARSGVVAAILLACAAFALGALLPLPFPAALAIYVATTLVYSFGLKRIAVLDVVTLAALYTLRIVAGALAIPVPASSWLLAFSLFLFLGLAMLKRYTEVGRVVAGVQDAVAGRGYRADHHRPLLVAGLASGALSVVVLAFYVDSTKSAMLYRHPQVLWALAPLLALWLGRVWQRARRGLMHDDPVLFALTDRISLAIGVACAATVALAV